MVILAHQLDRALERLGARIAEEHLVGKGVRNEALGEARKAVLEGRPPTGGREQRVVGGLVRINARMMNKTVDPEFEAWLLRHYDETSDPRMERYWHLVSILKEFEYDPSLAEAHRWLVEGLRWRVEQQTSSGGSWESLSTSLGKFSDDFPEDREQPVRAEDREGFDPA